MKRSAARILYLTGALFLANLSFAQDTAEVVTAWLKQNSIPIKYIKTGKDFLTCSA